MVNTTSAECFPVGEKAVKDCFIRVPVMCSSIKFIQKQGPSHKDHRLKDFGGDLPPATTLSNGDIVPASIT